MDKQTLANQMAIGSTTYLSEITPTPTVTPYTPMSVTNDPIVETMKIEKKVKIIVSGGPDHTTDDYYYEFIDSALREWGYEDTFYTYTYIFVLDLGWSKEDKEKILEWNNKWPRLAPHKIVFFKDKNKLLDLINNGVDGERDEEIISQFRCFSHGSSNRIWFTYGMTDVEINDKDAIDLVTSDLSRLNKEAFSKPYSIFYSCNTGTERDGTRFSQVWANMTSGTTKAIQDGRSWFGDINSVKSATYWYQTDDAVAHALARKVAGGYSVPYPAFRKPGIAPEDKKIAKWVKYEPEN